MPRRGRIGWLKTMGLIVSIVALLNTGCLPLVIGGLVAAGGAAGYAYYAGQYQQEYAVRMTDVQAAAKATLIEQGMPVLEEHADAEGAYLVSKTTTGERVSVTLTDFADAKAPGGFMTRVGVRVNAFGDPDYSKKLLDQIGSKLGVAPPPAPGNDTARLTPQPGESKPPPLADVKGGPPPGQTIDQAGWRPPQNEKPTPPMPGSGR